VNTFKKCDVPELRRAIQQLIKVYRYELQEVQECLTEAEKLYTITKGLSHEEILQIFDKLKHSKDINGSFITSDLENCCSELSNNAEPKPPKLETFPGVSSNSTKTTLVEYNTVLWYYHPVSGKKLTKGVVAHLNSRKTTLNVYGITKKWQKGRDIINEAIGDILPGKKFEGAELSRPELILVLNKLQALNLLV